MTREEWLAKLDGVKPYRDSNPLALVVSASQGVRTRFAVANAEG